MEMGYSASDLTEPMVLTDKNTNHLISNVIWLISGEGKPRKDFYLAAVFQVTRIHENPSEFPDFRYSVHGEGTIFGETIRLNDEPWFNNFKSRMQNFRFGLLKLDPTVDPVDELRKSAGPHAL